MDADTLRTRLHALRASPHFDTLTHLLESRREASVSKLVACTDDADMHRLQGAARELDALLRKINEVPNHKGGK